MAMDQKKYDERVLKLLGPCKSADFMPEMLFARGNIGERPALIVLSAPVLTIELITEMRETLDQL